MITFYRLLKKNEKKKITKRNNYGYSMSIPTKIWKITTIKN